MISMEFPTLFYIISIPGLFLEIISHLNFFDVDRRLKVLNRAIKKLVLNQISNLNDSFENLRLSETSVLYNTLRMFQVLEDPNNFNKPLGILPATVVSLTLGDNFDWPLDPLPYGMISLKLGDNFNFPLVPLPPSLKLLILGNNFNWDLKPLPPSLKLLILGNNFNCDLKPLPPSLKLLILGNNFNWDLKPLPSNLTLLTLDKNLIFY